MSERQGRPGSDFFGESAKLLHARGEAKQPFACELPGPCPQRGHSSQTRLQAAGQGGAPKLKVITRRSGGVLRRVQSRVLVLAGPEAIGIHGQAVQKINISIRGSGAPSHTPRR